MAKTITSAGIEAYSDSSGLSGAEMWKNYSRTLNEISHRVIDEVLDIKGSQKYKSE